MKAICSIGLTTPPSLSSRFTNRYGEEWHFSYDPNIGEGTLRGSDIDWQPFRVIGGQAYGLVLNEDELLWLRNAWQQATCGFPPDQVV